MDTWDSRFELIQLRLLRPRVTAGMLGCVIDGSVLLSGGAAFMHAAVVSGTLKRTEPLLIPPVLSLL